MQIENRSEKLSILYVFGGEKAQGAEIVIERLIAFNAEKWDTHLLLSPGAYADDLLTAGKPYKVTALTDLRKLNRMFTGKLAFYSRAISNYFKISYKVGRYIRHHHIDIVHCNTLVPAAYVAPLVLWSKVFMPHVKWLWSDHDMRYFSKLENILATRCFELYNRTLLVSGALKQKYNTNSPKLQVLYNGLDVNEFKPNDIQRERFRTDHGFGADDLLIGIAGSINPDKGQLDLIRVFNKLAVKAKTVKLLIAGNYAGQFPEHITLVEQAIAESPGVTYIGFIKDTATFYNGCDIIINNSNNQRSESLGTTIYEAMACQKLVIASATGGTPEIITHNVDGLLFEPENEAELAERLSYAINNYTTLKEVRQAARQKVIARFNIKTMAAEYDKMIKSLQ